MSLIEFPRIHLFTTSFQSNSNIRPLQHYAGETAKGSDLLALRLGLIHSEQISEKMRC